MNKKLFIILVIILVGGIGIGLFILNDKEPSLYVEKPSEDALKFKEEYESLNGTKRESDGAIYQDIKIDENNPVKYVNAKEALEVLKNKTAIMYVGANWCPWCRNAVPVLFEVAKAKNIETIYYLNLDDEKDSFEVKKGKLEKVTEGTDDYYKLLEFLNDYLEDYIITDSKGKKYDTKEKRIYMPYVIAAKNGKVVDTYTGTVELDKDQTKYDKMSKKQHDELYKNYDKLFSKIYASGTCKDNCN